MLRIQGLNSDIMVKTVRTVPLQNTTLDLPLPLKKPEIQELRVLPESAEHDFLGGKYIYVLKAFFCRSPRSLINCNGERMTN